MSTPGSSTPLEKIKVDIEKISVLPVSEHVQAYEEIHSDLQKALAEIEGL